MGVLAIRNNGVVQSQGSEPFLEGWEISEESWSAHITPLLLRSTLKYNSHLDFITGEAMASVSWVIRFLRTTELWSGGGGNEQETPHRDLETSATSERRWEVTFCPDGHPIRPAGSENSDSQSWANFTRFQNVPIKSDKYGNTTLHMPTFLT